MGKETGGEVKKTRFVFELWREKNNSTKAATEDPRNTTVETKRKKLRKKANLRDFFKDG